MLAISINAYDCIPDEAARVDAGLGESNDAAAPLHEVRQLSCMAHSADGVLLGGAIGRRWGSCCELQQLWVAPHARQQGIATRLVLAFEQHAQQYGCDTFYLETFSFQAPAFYESMGYRIEHTLAVYPHGIAKHLMIKQLQTAGAAVPPA